MHEHVALVERVRQEIRRSGVDPIRDAAGAHAVIDAAMGAYFAERLESNTDAAIDPAILRRQLRDSIAGFGALQKFFDDPEVEEVYVDELLDRVVIEC